MVAWMACPCMERTGIYVRLPCWEIVKAPTIYTYTERESILLFTCSQPHVAQNERVG